MTVLVLAPHPDDESIGCGGTLRLHVLRKDQVVAVFLTSGELGLKGLPVKKAWQIREQEARAAGKIIGLSESIFLRQPDWLLGDHKKAAAKLLQRVIKRVTPELIYLPHPDEWHPDHRASLPVLRAAMSGSGMRTPLLRAYEVWTPLAGYDHLENITTVMQTKLRALAAHKSQLKGEFDYRRAVIGLNQFRGALGGKSVYAEVFRNV